MKRYLFAVSYANRTLTTRNRRQPISCVLWSLFVLSFHWWWWWHWRWQASANKKWRNSLGTCKCRTRRDTCRPKHTRKPTTTTYETKKRWWKSSRRDFSLLAKSNYFECVPLYLTSVAWMKQQMRTKGTQSKCLYGIHIDALETFPFRCYHFFFFTFFTFRVWSVTILCSLLAVCLMYYYFY